MSRRSSRALVVIVAGVVAVAVAAGAQASVLARGTTSSLPWRLSAYDQTIGSQRLPALCLSFEWASGRGQKIANGFPFCIAPAIEEHGHWTFDLDAAGVHGIEPESSGTNGLRVFLAMTVPAARTLTVKLADHRVVHVATRPLPSSLGRAARVAWFTSRRRDVMSTASVLAYDSAGKLVGSWTKPRR